MMKFAFFAAALSLSGTFSVAQDLDCSFQQNIEILQDDLLTLRQISNPVDRSVSIELEYRGQGWLGFGFSSGGEMIGNVAVIGEPGVESTADSPNPAKYFLGSFGLSGVGRVSGARQTLADASISQNATHTTLRFTKLLEEADELAISDSESNFAIFAVGRTNTLQGVHIRNGAFPLLLSQCRDTNSTDDVPPGDVVVDLFNDELPRKNLWQAHGFMMAVAWGIIVPIAIGSSILRSLLPNTMWFSFHFGLNSLAVLTVIASFGLAVYGISDQNKKHFTEDTHRLVGLIVFLLAVLQLLSGLCRPHLRKPTTNGEEHPIRLRKMKPRQLWEYKHRIVGVSTLALAWWNCYSGIGLYAERIEAENEIVHTITFFAIAGGIVGTVFVVYCILRCT
mmetsp:Transcript_64686/g.173243  ORF Transcript_64686/g.173243 Transcript_64686/m.173243 type:complete len:393 (-) Transcript_64686:233-1411(-)